MHVPQRSAPKSGSKPSSPTDLDRNRRAEPLARQLEIVVCDRNAARAHRGDAGVLVAELARHAERLPVPLDRPRTGSCRAEPVRRRVSARRPASRCRGPAPGSRGRATSRSTPCGSPRTTSRPLPARRSGGPRGTRPVRAPSCQGRTLQLRGVVGEKSCSFSPSVHAGSNGMNAGSWIPAAATRYEPPQLDDRRRAAARAAACAGAARVSGCGNLVRKSRRPTASKPSLA